MKKLILLSYLFGILLGTSPLYAQNTKVKKKDITRVLFIGNSFTYVCNTPGIFGELCASRKKSVQLGMLAPGGCTFRGHLERPQTQQALQEKWDWVFIQGQSVEPATMPEEAKTMGKKLGEQVKATGAQLVLFNTWGYRDYQTKEFDLMMHKHLCKTYSEMAIELKCKIAPCGPAWKVINEKYPQIDLYQPNDGNCHQSLKGAYLNACIFYKIVTGKSPIGLPYKGKTFKLSPKEAKILQKVANDTVDSFTPEKFLAEFNAENNQLPEIEKVKATLKIGMPRSEVEKLLGQADQINQQEKLYIYKLRDEKQAWIHFDNEDKIKSASIEFWQLK